MRSNQNNGLSPTDTGSALSVAQVDRLVAQKEREVMEAAQGAAPITDQLQLARELIALRAIRYVGQGAILEVTDLSIAAEQAGATIGLLSQVTIDGLKGKVDDSVIERIARIRDTGMEAVEIMHATSAASLHERVENFKARSSDIRKRDVAYAVAFDKMPNKLGSGRR